MDETGRQVSAMHEAKLIALAREVAMEMRQPEDILKSYEITENEFHELLNTTHFQAILSEQVQLWRSTPNTAERVKLKHQSLVEEVLPEMYGRLMDRREPLSAKVELFKALQRGAGVLAAEGDAGSAKVSITINMGDRGVETVTQKVTAPIDYAGAEDV
jgi:hypothetical protein